MFLASSTLICITEVHQGFIPQQLTLDEALNFRQISTAFQPTFHRMGTSGVTKILGALGNSVKAGAHLSAPPK